MCPGSPSYFYFFNVLEIILDAAPTFPSPLKKLDIACFTESFLINHSIFSCDYVVRNKKKKKKRHIYLYGKNT